MTYKILIAHSTGLIGKSTMGASLLHPRLPAPLKVFSVEQQNQDASRYGIPVARYRGVEFGALWEDMHMETANVLLDVGASNYLQFMQEIEQLPGAINDFDVVIVPCTPDRRVQEETVTTIEDLATAGLEPAKLRVIFNRATAPRGTAPDIEFRIVVAYLKDHPEYPYYPDLVVPNRGVHTDLAAAGKSIADVLSDTKDYKTALEEATTNKASAKHRHEFFVAHTLQRAVAGAEVDLQAAFNALRLPFATALEGA